MEHPINDQIDATVTGATATADGRFSFTAAFAAAKRRVDDARRVYDAYTKTVFDPIYERRRAALATVPHHTTVNSYENVLNERVHLTTEEAWSVDVSRKHITANDDGEPGAKHSDEYIATRREHVEAADRRAAEIERIEAELGWQTAYDRQDELSAAIPDAIDAVLAVPAGSIADLAMKIDYADERDWWDDDTVAAIKADIRRLAMAMSAPHPLFATFDDIDQRAGGFNEVEPTDGEAEGLAEDHGRALRAAIALPNTPEHLRLRVRAISSSCNYNADVAALDLDELAAHADGYVGELVRQVLICVTARPAWELEQDPALELWSKHKAAYIAAAAACRNGEPYHQQHPHGVICDETDSALPDTQATTLAGVEGKLRNVFLQRNRSDWAEALVFGHDGLELRRQLALADLYDRMLWSAIDDLQRLGGEAVQ